MEDVSTDNAFGNMFSQGIGTEQQPSVSADQLAMKSQLETLQAQVKAALSQLDLIERGKLQYAGFWLYRE